MTKSLGNNQDSGAKGLTSNKNNNTAINGGQVNNNNNIDHVDKAEAVNYTGFIIMGSIIIIIIISIVIFVIWNKIRKNKNRDKRVDHIQIYNTRTKNISAPRSTK